MFLFRYVLCVSCVSFCKDTKKDSQRIYLPALTLTFLFSIKKIGNVEYKNIKDFKMGYFVYLSKNKIQ